MAQLPLTVHGVHQLLKGIVGDVEVLLQFACQLAAPGLRARLASRSHTRRALFQHLHNMVQLCDLSAPAAELVILRASQLQL